MSAFPKPSDWADGPRRAEIVEIMRLLPESGRVELDGLPVSGIEVIR